METVYSFHKLSNKGLLEDLCDVNEINPDENWFQTRDAAFAWLEKQPEAAFEAFTLILVEMIFT